MYLVLAQRRVLKSDSDYLWYEAHRAHRERDPDTALLFTLNEPNNIHIVDSSRPAVFHGASVNVLQSRANELRVVLAANRDKMAAWENPTSVELFYARREFASRQKVIDDLEKQARVVAMG